MADTKMQQRGTGYPPYVPARDVEDVRDRLGRLFNAPFNRLFREPATSEFGAMTVGWTPSVDFAGLVRMMVDADLERRA